MFKMYDDECTHLLKFMLIKNDSHFAIGKSLMSIADEVAIKAHNIMTTQTLSYVKKLTNQQITQDVILINQIGVVDVVSMIKPRWINSNEAVRLVHILGCSNIKDIIAGGTVTV